MMLPQRVLLAIYFCLYLFGSMVLHEQSGKIHGVVRDTEAKIVAARKAPGPAGHEVDVSELEGRLAKAHELMDQVRLGYFILNSAGMYLLFYALLWPPLASFLDKGAAEVADELRRAERRVEDAREKLAEAEAALGRIDEDAKALHDREVAAGQAEADALRERAALEVKQIAEHAEVSAAREAEHARDRVVAAVAAAVMDRAFKDLEGEVDEATRARLARELVEELAA